jgi:hypothetical protein
MLFHCVRMSFSILIICHSSSRIFGQGRPIEDHRFREEVLGARPGNPEATSRPDRIRRTLEPCQRPGPQQGRQGVPRHLQLKLQQRRSIVFSFPNHSVGQLV